MGKLARLVPRPLRREIKTRLQRRFGAIEMARPYEIVVDPAHRPLADKVAVVTGASGAIGRAIAVRLAVDGALVVAAARDIEKLHALADEISALGGATRVESVDLSDAAAVRDFASRVGPIHILVNNAGGSSRSRSAQIWEQAPETIDEVLRVNLRAAMLTTAAFGRGMIEGAAGARIINLGSTTALGGLSKFSEYAAAKAGVVGYTRSAALEFGPHGVTVNCVTPGIVQRDRISESKAASTVKRGVVPRLGRAEDIAEMVGFLAGPRAGWITGQEFVIDGGRSIGLHGES